MPPRHATPPVLPVFPSAVRRVMLLRFGIVALCVLIASGAPRVHAQSVPPAGAAPTDPFHQPCVAVRASPEASAPGARGMRHGVAALRTVATTPAAGRVARGRQAFRDTRLARSRVLSGGARRLLSCVFRTPTSLRPQSFRNLNARQHAQQARHAQHF